MNNMIAKRYICTDMKAKRRFIVIGISDSHDRSFSPQEREAIQSHAVFSGGIRHLEIVRPFLPEKATWISITVPLDHVYAQYEPYSDMVVFASGDPLFSGFANTLMHRYPDAEITVFPYFNSLQMLAHRLLLPYHDMKAVSLTGHEWTLFDKALIEGDPLIGVLTDRAKTPSAIAQRMLDYGYDNYTINIGERLGNQSEEQITTCTLQEAAQRSFRFPNNLILQRNYVRKRPFGIPEKEFHLLNGRAKMITKMPVRLLSLSMLDLRDRNHLWDIGFCTGSVSIEAKLQFPHLKITAFEQRAEGAGLMAANSRKFGTPGIRTITGDFMNADLNGAETPDAVFIGGHGGKLVAMIEKLQPLMAPGCVIVFNSVGDDSRRLFEEGIRHIGFRITDEIKIQINQYNTIDVLKAEQQ